jgi:hypothetical protein
MSNKGKIWKVWIFVTNTGEAERLAEKGVAISHIAPNELISRADADLGFEGALISSFNAAGGIITGETVPKMTELEWQSFLNRRVPPGFYWYRWFGQTPTAIYSLVVVTEPPPKE